MKPTVARLRELFVVKPDGCLLWVNPSKYHHDLRGQAAGSPLPNHHGKVYWCVQIDGRKIRRSRIVFCMMRGYWPIDQIDHINGNSLDDRPNNLREATATQNAWNHKTRAKRSLLPMGVRQDVRGKYVARIRVNHRAITLGTFLDVAQAEAAYRVARAQYFGEFA